MTTKSPDRRVGATHNITHGHARKGAATSRTYRSWLRMRSRCQNPKNTVYAYYGGRGIKVCERWQSFPNFLSDMGECPPGLTLERIDTNGDYTPDNCRWATRAEQAQNTPNVKLSPALAGEIRRRHAAGGTKKGLSREFNLAHKTVKKILNNTSWRDPLWIPLKRPD